MAANFHDPTNCILVINHRLLIFIIFSTSFNIHDWELEGLLDNFSLNEALAKNRIFIVDHSIMDGILDSENKQIVSFLLYYITLLG